MKRISLCMLMLIAVAAAGIPAVCRAAGTDARPLLTTENATPREVIAAPVRFKGYDGLKVVVSPDHKEMEQGGCDNCTFLELDNIDFRDGRIEIEVAGQPKPNAPKWARGFVGVVLRVDSTAKTWEGVYLRPLNAVEQNQVQRNHTVQYFSYPDHPWHELREKSPGAYETYAPVKPGEWTHLRIVVKDRSLKLFVNHGDEPVLVVSDLKLGPDARGTVGLFTEPETEAYFRNLVITHD